MNKLEEWFSELAKFFRHKTNVILLEKDFVNIVDHRTEIQIQLLPLNLIESHIFKIVHFAHERNAIVVIAIDYTKKSIYVYETDTSTLYIFHLSRLTK